MLGSGTVSTRKPFGRRYSVTPSTVATGCSACAWASATASASRGNQNSQGIFFIARSIETRGRARKFRWPLKPRCFTPNAVAATKRRGVCMVQADTRQTLGFQAEVKQLLSLMIHSLYSNKEIFLRELVSNGSDAADKLRFEALANPALYEGDSELKITLRIDKEARTLTVADNGIGMSRDEVIANIGTIAKSGTKEFLATLTGDQQKDARLIGQFGVGFYSSFIVADRVTLVTRRAGLPAAEGVRWESDGSGEYSIEALERRARGTEVTLHLREGEDELLEPWQVKSIVRKYSDHIGLPIVLTGESKVDPVTKEFMAGKEETLNQASALWARPKSEVTDEQYREFYKHVAHDFED